VESLQVYMESEEQRAIWKSVTHLNSVKSVCAVREYSGNPFQQMDYKDPETGSKVIKS
jgi:hypothetical protein